MKHVLTIAGITVWELIYERVFYLLFCFAVLALLLSLLLGQLTYVEQAKLTIDFMLGSIHLSMILFSIFMGISIFKKELVSGSVSMILSKPVSRGAFLMGKYLGQIVVALAVIAAMGTIAWLFCLRFGGHFSLLAVAQSLLLIFFEVAVMTAITYFFSVNAGAMTAAMGVIVVFCLGHLQETITKFVESPQEKNWLWQIVRGVIPDLEVFNMKALASYGLSLPVAEIRWLVFYCVICVILFLVLAWVTFKHKDITT